MPGFCVQLLYMLTYGSLYCSTQVNGEKVTTPVVQVRDFKNDLTGSHETNSNPGIAIQPPPGKLTVLVFNFYLAIHDVHAFLAVAMLP